MDRSNLDRAREVLSRTVHEVDSELSTAQVRLKLREAAEHILDLLESEEDAPADIISDLERQSQEIAEDLERVDRLMRHRARTDAE